MESLEQQIKNKLVEVLELDMEPDEIEDEQSLFGEEGLGLDSVDGLEVAAMLQLEFDVEIPNRDQADKVLSQGMGFNSLVLPSRVWVTGMGIASAVGWTVDETWQALASGRSGLGPLTLFPSERCGHLPVGQVSGDPSRRSGLAAGSRSDHLAVWAAQQAFQDAGLEPGAVPGARGAVVLGAITGGMTFLEAALAQLINEGDTNTSLKDLELIECCNAADRVAEALGLGGFRSTVSNACASGASSISAACDLLAAGEADLVLAGGTDSLNRVLVNGFNSLMLVAPDGCRPFDADRQGMTVGEGAGLLVLETEEHARARCARARAEVAGLGNSCDAHHATSPSPGGDGLLAAMELALADANVGPEAVDYVNAHGTGTQDNDLSEGRAMARLFGGQRPAISSTKGFFGHTMAAAGAIEAIVCILALEHQAVPPNLRLRRVDPDIGITPAMELAPAPLELCLSSSLGFGGNNSALLLRALQAEGGRS